MDTKKNIIEVFETIAHRRIQLTASQGIDDSIDLPTAQLLLEPRLHALEQQVTEIYKQHGIDDDRVGSLRAAESVTGFVVGILAGLDLAGRPDIVKRFAGMYAKEAKQAIDSLFTNHVN